MIVIACCDGSRNRGTVGPFSPFLTAHLSCQGVRKAFQSAAAVGWTALSSHAADLRAATGPRPGRSLFRVLENLSSDLSKQVG